MAKPDDKGGTNPLDALKASSDPDYVTEVKSGAALSAADKARDFLAQTHSMLDGMGDKIGPNKEVPNAIHVTLYKDDKENRYAAYGGDAVAVAGYLGKIPRIDNHTGRSMVYLTPAEVQSLRNYNFDFEIRDGNPINYGMLPMNKSTPYGKVAGDLLGATDVIDKMRETMENIQANISDTFEKLYQSEQKGTSRGYGI